MILRDPRTGKCTYADLTIDGKWRFPDGRLIEEKDLEDFSTSSLEGLIVLIGGIIALVMIVLH